MNGKIRLPSIEKRINLVTIKEAARILGISHDRARQALGKPDLTMTGSKKWFYKKDRVLKIKQQRVALARYKDRGRAYGAGRSNTIQKICEKCHRTFNTNTGNIEGTVCRWCRDGIEDEYDPYGTKKVYKLGTRLCPICKKNYVFIGEKVCEKCKVSKADQKVSFNDDFLFC